ncbi:hypothetical protein [Alcaligenes endophyticus]|uniref:Addiction module toxin RelE n=1 Tax=Alcaligenes endophyticus TaxID=1929088 RepID=A0ABT8EKV6_9BURK|nr:hypothetical protein [Alcaligenes endophyticus]MCX5590704.1 hypothetical protein [Alcaligenes endophyticus]MDN4121932.1 hypothetical protein [Alcaligenes endophyticus]
MIYLDVSVFIDFQLSVVFWDISGKRVALKLAQTIRVINIFSNPGRMAGGGRFHRGSRPKSKFPRCGQPPAGDLMEGTGGVRGIYYFHDDAMPLYLLTLFAKGDKVNLSQAERNELAGLVDLLVQIWKG